MSDPIRDVERSIEVARDCSRRVARLIAERDAAEMKVSEILWGPLLDAEEANDLLRGQRDRLRVLVARLVVDPVDPVLAARIDPEIARGIEKIHADVLQSGDMGPLK